MKLALGIILTFVGGLAALIVTPYAFIVGIMSGFSDDPAMTLFYAIAIPLACIASFITGVILLWKHGKYEKEK